MPTPELTPEVIEAFDDSFKPSKSKTSINWNNDIVKTLLEALIEQMRLSKKSENAFKSETYKIIILKIQKLITQQNN